MKKMMKFVKFFLLVTTIFSYIASPVAVLADEIISMPLTMQLKLIRNNGYADKYELTYESTRDDYDIEKDYKIVLDSTFVYTDGTEVDNTLDFEVDGNTLNTTQSKYELDPISIYYDGSFSLDVTVFDGEEEIYKDSFQYDYSALRGLTGKLNELAPTDEKKEGTITNGNYDVTTAGVYTQNLSVLTGELSPNGSYRIVYGENNYSDVMTADTLRGTVVNGSVTDLTDALAGEYTYTDTVVIEEVTIIEEVVEVKNTYTYTYNGNIQYGNDNDELLNGIYGNIFEDGYITVNAKELYDTEKVITFGEIIEKLNGTNIEFGVLDEEGNQIDLTNEEALLGEIKNGYTLKFIKGATASYVVIVNGDNNLDNTFNKEDLSSTIEDYLANEKVFSMDFVRLEKIEDGEEEPELEEFGTITFEDLLFTNELLKEDGNIQKEELDNTGLTLEFSEVTDELFVGDTFNIDVLINSEDVTDYIDGINSVVATTEHLRLAGVTFNEAFTGNYNDEGMVVGVGQNLMNGEVLMTLTFEAIDDGEATIMVSGNTSKFLNIDEFETISTVLVIGRKSSNNYLSSLNANVGTFDVTFDKDVTAYTLTVPHNTESVILSGSIEDVLAKVDGLVEYELTGERTTAVITVTAEDGSVKTYTVYIVKKAAPKPVTYYYSSNNYLKELEVDGYELEFNKYTNEYRINVLNNVTTLDIRALAEHSRSRVEITGNDNFKVGENVVTVKVTAENGNVREYKLIVVKEEKKPVTEIESNTAEKIVIIVLIILVVLGLLYLIFKKDDEEVDTPVKREDPRDNKKNSDVNKNSNNNNSNSKKKKNNNKNKKK